MPRLVRSLPKTWASVASNLGRRGMEAPLPPRVPGAQRRKPFSSHPCGCLRPALGTDGGPARLEGAERRRARLTLAGVRMSETALPRIQERSKADAPPQTCLRDSYRLLPDVN